MEQNQLTPTMPLARPANHGHKMVQKHPAWQPGQHAPGALQAAWPGRACRPRCTLAAADGSGANFTSKLRYMVGFAITPDGSVDVPRWGGLSWLVGPGPPMPPPLPPSPRPPPPSPRPPPKPPLVRAEQGQTPCQCGDREASVCGEAACRESLCRGKTCRPRSTDVLLPGFHARALYPACAAATLAETATLAEAAAFASALSASAKAVTPSPAAPQAVAAALPQAAAKPTSKAAPAEAAPPAAVPSLPASSPTAEALSSLQVSWAQLDSSMTHSINVQIHWRKGQHMQLRAAHCCWRHSLGGAFPGPRAAANPFAPTTLLALQASSTS